MATANGSTRLLEPGTGRPRPGLFGACGRAGSKRDQCREATAIASGAGTAVSRARAVGGAA